MPWKFHDLTFSKIHVMFSAWKTNKTWINDMEFVSVWTKRKLPSMCDDGKWHGISRIMHVTFLEASYSIFDRFQLSPANGERKLRPDPGWEHQATIRLWGEGQPDLFILSKLDLPAQDPLWLQQWEWLPLHRHLWGGSEIIPGFLPHQLCEEFTGRSLRSRRWRVKRVWPGGWGRVPFYETERSKTPPHLGILKDGQWQKLDLFLR